jgi:hypothetical protein
MKGDTIMSTALPPNNLSDLITQWINRFENHKKKIAAEEKITEMKFGTKTTYYIQHAEEGTLSSSDKRRHSLYQYKNFVNFIDHLIKEKNITENVQHLLERIKANSEEPTPKKSGHLSLNKIKQLANDFQNELNQFLLAQKKSEPSDEIKR